MADISIRELQERQPWRDTYSQAFKESRIPHKNFAHALTHLSKAAGQLSAIVDDGDHESPLAYFPKEDVEKFARIVRSMASGHHREPAGFGELLDLALSMNGGGRHRKVRWKELVALRNPQRLHARQGREARKIQSELHGDMQSQAEMTWPSTRGVRAR